MDLTGYLPPAEDGILPYVVLLVGVTALTNAVSCYFDDQYVRRLYQPYGSSPSSGIHKSTETTTTYEDDPAPQPNRRPSVASIVVADSPVTRLQCRTFATWNFAVGLVRIFAAYHLSDPSWYHLQMLVNVVGIVHFGMEAFYWKTAQPKGPWLAPVLTASTGVVWSALQYNHYVR